MRFWTAQAPQHASQRRAAGFARRRWAVVLGQYTLAIVLTILLVTKLLFLYRGDLRMPLSYTGDALLFETWCKAVVDHGWYLHNPNLSAPHGQSLEDFPQAEGLNFLMVKFFTLFTRDAQVAINLFTMSTYVCTTLASLLVLRHLGIAYPPALACALLYSLLPYHFFRVDCGHHLLACYHIVPLSILLALWLYLGRLPWPFSRGADVDGAARADNLAGGPPWVRWCLALGICLLQGSAGVYYAFFAEYFLVVAGMAACIGQRKLQPLATTGVLAVVTLGSVASNLVPSLLYWKEHGPNPAVAVRPLRDSEVYAFKLSAMLLPVPGHRIAPLDRLRERYERESFLTTENTWSAQGLVANVGFMVLLGLLLYRKPVSRLLEGLTVLNIFGILLGTVGGFGVLFSLLVSPHIRSQNRISIFLSFFSLACIAVLLQAVWQRVATTRNKQHLVNGLLIGMVVLGLWEQHPQQCRPDFPGVKCDWTADAQFVAQIESSLPPGAMVFQFPQMTFPEASSREQLGAYHNLRFYLHSNSLRWSGGAMRGREADRWQQQIAALSLADQLQAVAAAGFQGIQVSRRGYADQGQELERQLREQLAVEPIVSPSGHDSFFSLHAGQASRGTLGKTADRQR